MKIEINKSTKIGAVSGGDAGPGAGDGGVGVGNMYNWSLPISQIDPSTGTQKIVINTLNGAIAVICAVAQNTCQGVSFLGGGGYDGVNVSYGGSSELTMNLGQLQAQGSEIDLSRVDDPGFADLSKLPVGTFTAAPVPGVTKWPLEIIIK
jgi:hypothetical protein